MSIIQDFFEGLGERFSHPFWRPFIISWIAVNWKVWYITLFVTESSSTEKISYIENLYSTSILSFNSENPLLPLFFYPASLSILYTVVGIGGGLIFYKANYWLKAQYRLIQLWIDADILNKEKDNAKVQREIEKWYEKDYNSFKKDRIMYPLFAEIYISYYHHGGTIRISEKEYYRDIFNSTLTLPSSIYKTTASPLLSPILWTQVEENFTKTWEVKTNEFGTPIEEMKISIGNQRLWEVKNREKATFKVSPRILQYCKINNLVTEEENRHFTPTSKGIYFLNRYAMDNPQLMKT